MDEPQGQAGGWTQPGPEESAQAARAQAAQAARLNYTPVNTPAPRTVNMTAIIVACVIGIITFVGVLVLAVALVVPASRSSSATPSPSVLEPAVVPIPAPVVDEDTGPTVERAKAALEAEEPALYDRISHPDEPQVGDRKGDKAYTWEYLDAGSSAAQVRRVTVILDPDGKLVAISRD